MGYYKPQSSFLFAHKGKNHWHISIKSIFLLQHAHAIPRRPTVKKLKLYDLPVNKYTKKFIFSFAETVYCYCLFKIYSFLFDNCYHLTFKFWEHFPLNRFLHKIHTEQKIATEVSVQSDTLRAYIHNKGTPLLHWIAPNSVFDLVISHDSLNSFQQLS